MVETLASSADVCFGVQKLDTKEKGELYELIKGFLKGRKERGLRGPVEENGDMQLNLSLAIFPEDWVLEHAQGEKTLYYA